MKIIFYQLLLIPIIIFSSLFVLLNNFAFADTTINNVVTNEQFFSSLINTIFDLIEFNDEQQISFLTLIVFPFAALFYFDLISI